MANKIKLTLRAEQDLKDIWKYTAKTWGDEQANHYLGLLEKRFSDLVKSPFMGVARPDIGYDCRYFPEGKHLIFYRVINDDIEILGIPHANMDINSI